MGLLALAMMLPAQPQGAAGANDAAWSWRENRDAAAGPRYASVTARSAEGDRLLVRCDLSDDPVISVQYLPRKTPGSATDKPVTVIPDQGTPLVANWEFPGPGALMRGAQTFDVVRGIAGARELRVMTTNADGEPIGAIFAGGNGDAPFRRVYAACGLPYAPPAPVVPAAPTTPSASTPK